MKIELKVIEIVADLVTLIDTEEKIINLPSNYFDHQVEVDESIFLNINEVDNQAKNILNEIFNQN